MKNPKGCWVECTAAALALFCTIGLNINAFSVYIPYLTETLVLNPAQSSGFLMARNLCSVAGVFCAKPFYEKLNIRFGYTLALGLSILALFLFTSARSFAGVCLAAATSGLCYGLGGMYPVSILIHRWFPLHEGLAMGICAASTGLAITVGAPVLTMLVENRSMHFAMYCEMAFLLCALVACFCLIRNYPEGGLHYDPVKRTVHKRHKLQLSWMFLALVCMGTLGGAFSCLTLHYTTEGFDPYQVSLVVSIVGLVLTAAKFLLGGLMDVWGAYKTNWLFLSLAILSCLLFSLGSAFGFAPAVIAAVLYGIGDSVCTVGVTTYARDLSRPDNFSATQQQYQTANLLGGLFYALVSGLTASVTGNYRAFYLIIAGLATFATVVVQSTYAKRGGK